jgi:hypothetical protein
MGEQLEFEEYIDRVEREQREADQRARARMSGTLDFALPNGANGDYWFQDEDAGIYSSPHNRRINMIGVIGSGHVSGSGLGLLMLDTDLEVRS